MYYSDIQTRLIEHHKIPESLVPAFMGRLKHFQRLKWPEGSNTGRGRQALYTERMYRELFFAIEINALGIPPEKAIETVKANLPLLHITADDGGVALVHCPSAFGGRVCKSALSLNIPKLD